MGDVVHSVQHLTDVAERAFLGVGCSPLQASTVAAALIDAELAGQGGHGLRRFPAYSAQVKTGKVNGKAEVTIERPRDAVLHIDAGHGFAYAAIDRAVDGLAEMAPKSGIAAAAIYNSHHAGVAGIHVEKLAQRGLVALMFANAPAAMAPWGGRTPLYGTNPIAFACPATGRDPIVVDVSLSKVARGKVMAAEQKGEAIPEGWAFDVDGNPTTDPAAAMAGTMAPLGDAKGSVLALMVELLAAGLTGANFAYEATSLFDDKGPPPSLGQTLIAIDPTAFGGSRAVDRFAEMARVIAAQEGARVPGDRRVALARDLRRTGIAVPDDLYAKMVAAAV